MKRNSIIISLCIVLLLGFSVAAIAQNSSEVYQAQKALKNLGYNPGKLDGFLGNATKSAIEQFQRNVGLPLTGQLDEQTKARLGIKQTGRALKIKRHVISPSGNEIKGNQWLFVIGIDTYIRWPRLKTAVSDAKVLKDVLISRYHFDKDHIIELYDEQATRKNIIGKLRYLANHVQEDDSLVIFYAGHGHLDSITKSGSWIPVESGIKDASAWISNNHIKNYLKVDAIKAKHILLISDSCFSGDFFRGHRGKLPKVTDEIIKRSYKLTSRQAITSGGLEPVVDEGFGNHSVFSYFLIKTLKENQKPFLIPSDFFPDIKAGVAENAEQFPQFGSLKGTGGQQGGELVLFLKQSSKLIALSDKASARQKEFEHLKQLAAATEKARKKEAEAISRQEKELAELDKRINEMRERLGTEAKKSDDTLEALFAIVRQKEDQERKLKELEQKRLEEERKRKDELQRLKEEQQRKSGKAFKEDLNKYFRIVTSKYGKNMKEAAWKSLISLYPEGEGLKIGDIDRLKFVVLGGGRKVLNRLGMEFVYIPPGPFVMGSPSNEPGRENDEKQHKVTLAQGFYMQTTEVTQGQWKAIMGNNPSNFKGNDLPVERVSWKDVQGFIRRLNQREGSDKYRLPTEAEWEYACRAGSMSRFSFGDDESRLGQYAWYNGNSLSQTHTVAGKKPNAWGLYDMHGNVWEWTQDWYADYPSSDVTDPDGPLSGAYRVFRGGSWLNGPGGVRSARRGRYYPGSRYDRLGFRLAMD